jgi:DNA-binding Lrp family transcriptional regulator
LNQNSLKKILKAVERLGLDNISALSEETGIPIETLRYMIWKELPKHGIDIGVSLDLARIGLQSYFLRVHPEQKGFADAIESLLKSSKGIMKLNRIMPTNSFTGFACVPFGQERLLSSTLERLVESNIVKQFTLEQVEWTRNVSLNLDFYDFETKGWNIDWSLITNTTHVSPVMSGRKPRNPDPSLLPRVDYKDLMILSEFQKKIPRTISELSKRTGVDAFNLRYHYNHHARCAIRSFYSRMLAQTLKQGYSSFDFIYTISGQHSFAEARNIALSLPFTTSEWKSAKEYGWSVSCPGEYSNEAQRFVTGKFAKIQGSLSLLLTDSTSRFISTLPYEFFDETNERWKSEPLSQKSVVHI